MTIRPGEEWGTPAARPNDLRLCPSDADLVAHLLDADERPSGPTGGDLHRVLGAPPERDPVQRLPVDLLRVEADGAAFTAIAHVVVRRSWWRGPLVAVMNTGQLGRWNVAPRAHPNDGRFNVVDVDGAMPVRQRLLAARRLPQGIHVPHPSITTRVATQATWSFSHPMHVWIDGVDVATAREVSVHLDQDAAVVFA